MAVDSPLLIHEGEAARWWHYLAFPGLDAPLILTLWMWIIARVVDVQMSPSVYIAAFSAVWAVYLADRLIDIRHCRDWKQATARLRFGKQFEKYFWIALVACITTGLLILVCNQLPHEVAIRGGKIAVGVIVYFLLFVAPPFFKKRKMRGKEFFVGLIFAGGIGAAIGFTRDTLWYLVLFELAVAYNCLLIASRDFDADTANDPGGASQWWSTLRRDLKITGALFATVSLLFGFIGSKDSIILTSCFAASFAAMTVLHFRSESLTATNVRALADFCLLTPLVGIWFV